MAPEDEEDSQRALRMLRYGLDELARLLAKEALEEINKDKVRQDFSLIRGTDEMFDSLATC